MRPRRPGHQDQGRAGQAAARGDKDANVDSDFAWKAIGIYDRAVQDYPAKSPEVRQLVDAFAAGWDAYLTKAGADGIDGWCKGADWVQPITGLDVYAYARAVALQASSGQSCPTSPRPSRPHPRPPAPPTSPPRPWPPPRLRRPHPAATEPPPFDMTQASASLGSNGWALGSDRTESGGGMLLANPHFPWEKELRFWEVQLTIPGQTDIYGVQLSGLPGVGIGFTDSFAWTHTVSAGNRFTAYTLDLVPGSPTTYKYDDGQKAMTSKPIAIDVKQPDGTTTTTTKTAWSSHYGPIIAFPGVGWTDSMTITYRVHANIDDDAFLDQYLAMDQAKNLDEFIAAHRDHQGVPLFNTIAVSRDGRAWYADTSATPDLSPAAIAAYQASLETGSSPRRRRPAGRCCSTARTRSTSGSTSRVPAVPAWCPTRRCRRSSGPTNVFNANDSFWIPNADHPLAGALLAAPRPPGHAPIAPHPRERRRPARHLGDGPAGADGTFDPRRAGDLRSGEPRLHACELRRTPSSRAAGPTLGRRARAAQRRPWPRASGRDGRRQPGLRHPRRLGRPLRPRRQGAALRRSHGPLRQHDLDGVGALWAQPFDPAEPVATPGGLAAPPAACSRPGPGEPGPGRADLHQGRPAHRPPLGELQYADRNGERIPIHGGTSVDGITNVVGYNASLGGSTEHLPHPQPPRRRPTPLLAPKAATWLNNGTSFLMPVDFGAPGSRWTPRQGAVELRRQSGPVPTRCSSTRPSASARRTGANVTLGVDVVKNADGVQTEQYVSGSRSERPPGPIGIGTGPSTYQAAPNGSSDRLHPRPIPRTWT